MLRFKLLQFRAYSQTTESGGGTYSSTDGGGVLIRPLDREVAHMALQIVAVELFHLLKVVEVQL